MTDVSGHMDPDPLAAAWASLGKAGRDGIAAAVLDAAFEVYRRAGCPDDFVVVPAAGMPVCGAAAPEGSLRFGSREPLFWLPHVGFRVDPNKIPSAGFLWALDEIGGPRWTP